MRSQINIPEAEARELVGMWAPQMAEHALFLHLLLNDAPLKEEALEIFDRWRKFICEDNMRNIRDVLPLIEELKAYKEDVLARLNAGEWLGAAFPSFVDHILRELIYFANKLAGVKLSSIAEVAFWNSINSEHAAFASHLLDPSEEELHDKADATHKKIKDLPVTRDIKSIVLALEAGVELTEFNKQAYLGALENKIKSVIPASLLYHVIREGQHGNAVLNKLLGQPSDEVIPPAVCRH